MVLVQTGRTALHHICENAMNKVVDAVLAAGADKNAQDKKVNCIECWLIKNISHPVSLQGWTPLKYCAYECIGSCEDALLAAGADVDIADNVICAINSNFVLSIACQTGETPLMLACRVGNMKFAEKLIRRNANQELRNNVS